MVFATCGDRGVAAAVDERAAAFGAWALGSLSASSSSRRPSATVVLSLRERSSSSSTSVSSFSSSSSSSSSSAAAAASSLPWETWSLPIRVSPRREGEEEQQEEEEEQAPPLPVLRGGDGVRSLLLSISSRAAARTSHIPPVLTASVVTFPFEIRFEGGAAVAEPATGAAAAAGFSSSSSTRILGSLRQRNSSLSNPRSSPSPSSLSPSPSPSAGSVLRGSLGAVKRLLQAAPPPPVLG